MRAVNKGGCCIKTVCLSNSHIFPYVSDVIVVIRAIWDVPIEDLIIDVLVLVEVVMFTVITIP